MSDSPHDKYKLIFDESLSCGTIHTHIPDMIRKFGTDFQCNPFQIYPLDVVEIQNGAIWQVSVETTNGRHVIVGIDASNEDLLYIYDGSKKVKGNMNISNEEALKIAENYIQSKLTSDKLNEIELENIKYKEAAADDLPRIYKISYARIISGIPSLSDGIQVRVNAEIGEVTSYRIRWSMNEKDIITYDTEPSVIFPVR
ncbi:YcdB/YcdC domain-containing protein [uncultured Methanolobus sp.]|uniref:YcdB/YcdC domain-containing protein n=1 Tax=uncultured Methanolobus sp. TaxID=218300 RepID=UPI002AAAC2F4|nr:YcdB/YcdC domain-containing protein [uncultured Methanolobus sp.]